MACELKAVVAVCEDWGIGCRGGLLVSNRADMRRFVSLTMGHPVIMGRPTLEGFPGGRPLKGRRNIVLTRDAAFARAGAEAVHDLDAALVAVAGETEAWVIGGAQVYRALLPLCSEVALTRNFCTRPSDAFFPDLDADPAWEVAEAWPPAEVAPGEGDAGLSYQFLTYRRTGAAAERTRQGGRL